MTEYEQEGGIMTDDDKQASSSNHQFYSNRKEYFNNNTKNVVLKNSQLQNINELHARNDSTSLVGGSYP